MWSSVNQLQKKSIFTWIFDSFLVESWHFELYFLSTSLEFTTNNFLSFYFKFNATLWWTVLVSSQLIASIEISLIDEEKEILWASATLYQQQSSGQHLKTTIFSEKLRRTVHFSKYYPSRMGMILLIDNSGLLISYKRKENERFINTRKQEIFSLRLQ